MLRPKTEAQRIFNRVAVDSPTYRFWGRNRPQAGAKTPIRAEAPQPQVDAGVAVLRLYDPIDDWGDIWGVSAKEFLTALDGLPDDTQEIRLHVNSPGGVVTEGIAILNALRNHPARVVAVVDGLAASAASWIVVGSDEVVMNRNTELMIHDPWGMVVGDARDMKAMATLLDKEGDNIASIYAEKAGGTLAEWRDAMLAETWYTADEAVAIGLADRIQGADGSAAKNRYDTSWFNYPDRAHAPEPFKPAASSSPAPLPPAAPAAALAAPAGDSPATIEPVQHERLVALLTATRHGGNG